MQAIMFAAEEELMRDAKNQAVLANQDNF